MLLLYTILALAFPGVFLFIAESLAALPLLPLRAVRGVEPAADYESIKAFFWTAYRSTWGRRWRSALAPYVTLVAIPFRDRTTGALPGWAKDWDNNVSNFGDGEYVFVDGDPRTRGHGIGWAESAEMPIFRYDSSEYPERAYYVPAFWSKILPASWLRPRGWFAIWCWIGFRNRASKYAALRGPEAPTSDPVVTKLPSYTLSSVRAAGGDLWLLVGTSGKLGFQYGCKLGSTPIEGHIPYATSGILLGSQD